MESQTATISDNKVVYKLKKGVVSSYRDPFVPIVFMCIDSLDLPLDDILENYNIKLGYELYNDLKMLGY